MPARKAETAGARAAGATRTKFALAVQYAVEEAGLPTRAELRKWAHAAAMEDVEVTLRLVGMEEGRALNRDYRGRDYATNVLTFAYPETQPLSGDIVLCAPVVTEEARRQHKSLQAHYAHLVVHGMLHLQGYDHENDANAFVMEALETAIVIDLGYADPYKDR